MARSQYRIAVIGTNKTGKTTYAMQLAKDAIEKGRKVVIFNLGNEEKWYSISKAKPFSKKSQFVHIDSSFLSIKNKITPSKLIDYFLQSIVDYDIKHGLIIIDDAAGVIPANKMEFLKIAMIQSRQRDLDYLLLFHHPNEIPNSIAPNITHYAIGYTTGKMNTAINKLPEHIIQAAESVKEYIDNNGGWLNGTGKSAFVRKLFRA